MPDLAAYLNVYNSALVVLEQKGYSLRFDPVNEWWYATRGEWEFVADDPMQLLGLASIYEFVKPVEKSEYWWRLDQPDLLGKLDPRID